MRATQPAKARSGMAQSRHFTGLTYRRARCVAGCLQRAFSALGKPLKCSHVLRQWRLQIPGLHEHLAHVRLLAPVSDIEVLATEVAPIVESSQSFLPDTSRQGEALGQVLERIQARLGGRRVLRPRLVQDHRPEWMQRWQALDAARPNAGMEQAQAPQPAWILRTPMKLAMLGNRPLYQGPLLLLLGPDRVEGGWWHRAEGAEGADGARGLNVQRDYWVALSKHAGVLWIFRQRLGPDGNAWYLHGHFA